MSSQKSNYKPMIWGIIITTCVCFVIATAYRADRFTKAAEAMTPPVGEFIEIDGTRVHYIKKGSGPNLILLHGAGGHLKDYSYGLIPELSKKYTVLAFDRPGHGYTDKLDTDGATLAEQSELIYKAAQELGVNDAYVVGYSFGGALALNMGVYKPEFTKGLVLVSSVAMPWPGPLHFNYRLMSKPIIGPAVMATATAYLSNDYFKSSYGGIFEPHMEPTGFMDHVGVNMSVRYQSFVENSRQLIKLRPQIVEQSKLYPALNMPITFLHGIDDTSVPLAIHAQEFVKVLPSARLKTIPNMGHAALQLAPEQVVEAIEAMIAPE